MFRDMRRKNQLLPQEEAEAMLRQGTSGVLSLLGDGGYPYGVPLSYVYHNGKLYFHCAKAGHKLDAIRREGKCSFCVIDQDQVVAEKYTTSTVVCSSVGVLSCGVSVSCTSFCEASLSGCCFFPQAASTDSISRASSRIIPMTLAGNAMGSSASIIKLIQQMEKMMAIWMMIFTDFPPPGV